MSSSEAITTVLMAVPFAAWLTAALVLVGRWLRLEVRPRRLRAQLRVVPPPAAAESSEPG